MPVPPVGWGACEILIYNLAEAVRALGHTVDIYNNPNIEEVSNQINSIDYDFIHASYDNHAEPLLKFLKKKFCITSHYGFINRQEAWDPHYHYLNQQVLKCPGIIALSPEISSLYDRFGYNGFKRVLRNGADVKKFRFSEKGNGKAICLGKIEPRKSNNYLASRCNGIEIDYWGPLAEPFRGNETNIHRGELSKEQLYDQLTEYSTLVLLSAGEAAPLVLPEAMAAGLSIVISPWCTANLPLDKKWITVIDTQDKLNNLPAYINGAIGTNQNYRQEIRSFAERYFDWSIIVGDYIKTLEEWKEYNKQ